MRRDDRGQGTSEYIGMLLLLGVVVVVVGGVTGVGGQIVRGIQAAVCEVIPGPSCPGVATAAGDDEPEPDGAGDGGSGGNEGNPVLSFLAGGVDRVAGSTGTAGCLVHLCGQAEFEETWGNVAHAATAPQLDDVRWPCDEWAEPAEGTARTRPDGSPRQDYTVGTFNMAGSTENDGGLGVVDAIERSVEDRRPAFLALNEVCENQAEALLEKLGDPTAHGQPGDYTVHFEPVRAHDAGTGREQVKKCDNGEEYGNAVLYRTDIGKLAERGYDLGTPDLEDDHEKRGMACVHSAAQRVAFCSAHLTNDDEGARETEAKNLRETIAAKYPGYTIMLGGDMNDTPGSETLNNLYDAEYGYGADGALKEVDSAGVSPLGSCRDGETTIGSFFDRRKYDYIFTSGDVGIRWSDSTHSDHSDHDPVWSGVTF